MSYLQKFFREIPNKHKISTTKWKWLVMDGPVDTTWVENMNTALDDTRTLCLANGERIDIPDNLRFIFEVDSLKQVRKQRFL